MRTPDSCDFRTSDYPDTIPSLTLRLVLQAVTAACTAVEATSNTPSRAVLPRVRGTHLRARASSTRRKARASSMQVSLATPQVYAVLCHTLQICGMDYNMSQQA